MINANPIPAPIQSSNLSIGLQEIATIPNSGTGEERFPRLNLLSSTKDSTGRLFVNDTRGILYAIDGNQVIPYLDVRPRLSNFQELSGQQGLTYFAFHPEFAVNGIFYTVTSEQKTASRADFPVNKPIVDRNGQRIESSHYDVIREWKATNPYANTFNGTVRKVVTIEQPYRDHNIGQIAFNPLATTQDSDYGNLYIALGDGGSDGFPVGNTDPLNMGQDLNSPLGKILRINPQGNNSRNRKYGIPEDNLFVNDNKPNTSGEIWAYGFRNPHRYSWDAVSGKMLIVDIGQAFIEEVNLGVRGGNYGWGNREGTFVITDTNENTLYPLPKNDASFGYRYPVAQYDHDIPGNVAIAGGYVYRGRQIPELAGQYVFADFAEDGRFFHVPSNSLVNGRQATLKELRLFNGLATTDQSFLEIVNNRRTDLRFGEDEDKNLFVTTKRDGKIRMVVRSPEFSRSAQLFVNDVTVIEGINSNNTTANFIVTLNRPTPNTVIVNYATENRTAIAGSDYVARSGTIRFNPGEIRQKITVPIINDNSSEPNETFKLKLSNPRNATIHNALGTATISDVVQSSLNMNLHPRVENLTLMGRDNIQGIGNNLNNRISGNNGHNLLNGGQGNDTLIGGVGRDIFAFNAPNSGRDIITDFNPNSDRLQLSSIGFNLPVGRLPSSAWKLGTQATDSRHRVIYNLASGELFWDHDGIGGVAQSKIATLTNNPLLTNTNFRIK